MKFPLYVAVVIDRHIDPIIRVFSCPERAREWARATFQKLMAHPENIQEDKTPVGDYVWTAKYGEEEDRAWVEERELDEERGER